MEEDTLNRPWRPLPSGRISGPQATILRYLLIPGCFLLSIHISVNATAASTWLAIAFFLYDDMGFAAHWYSKNVMNSLGYLGFEYGATCIMAPAGLLRPEARLSLLTSPLIILTTVHAQDFSDIEGDKALGRCTLPVSFPTFSKILVCVGVPMWTFFLLHLWCFNIFPALGLALLSMTVSLRFYMSQTPKEFSTSYVLYNVWLLAVHAVPSIGHISTL
ncbi:hypothetical protein PM082_017143 [Marasmius tenuissimus]|nr:hypothetical protein PM082_017143 [Marasmius tenuissimus]